MPFLVNTVIYKRYARNRTIQNLWCFKHYKSHCKSPPTQCRALSHTASHISHISHTSHTSHTSHAGHVCIAFYYLPLSTPPSHQRLTAFIGPTIAYSYFGDLSSEIRRYTCLAIKLLIIRVAREVVPPCNEYTSHGDIQLLHGTIRDVYLTFRCCIIYS